MLRDGIETHLTLCTSMNVPILFKYLKINFNYIKKNSVVIRP